MCLSCRMSSLLFFSIFIFTGLGIYGLLLRKKGLRSRFTETWTVYCFVMSIVCLVLAYCISICDSWKKENKRRNRSDNENSDSGASGSGIISSGRRYGPSVVKSGPLPPLTISNSALHGHGPQSATTSPRDFTFTTPSPRSASSTRHFVFPAGTYLQVSPAQSSAVSPSRSGRYYLATGSTRSIASAPVEGSISPLENGAPSQVPGNATGSANIVSCREASSGASSAPRSPRERPVLFVVVPRGSALQLPVMLDMPRSPNSPLDRRCVRRCCSLPRSGHRRARRFYQHSGGSGVHGHAHAPHSTPPPSPRQVCLVLPSQMSHLQQSRTYQRRRSNSFSGLDAVRPSHRSSDHLNIPGRVGAVSSASTGDISFEDDPPSYASLCEDPPPYSEIIRPVSHAASQTSDPGSDPDHGITVTVERSSPSVAPQDELATTTVIVDGLHETAA
ncbi:uncharacterized protein LOC100904057 [Galendromus occidentalis]|uniref:Uncharacterized protein LOC100904057 n=1 Tax=Galendromus occidentalis TaxID=34638 RepID=A0AAJ6W053_9ACAR|nr:uncharacterized protein LOC100904057 [Galendromus occidentalis]